MPDGPRTRIRVFFGAGLILAALIGGARSGRLGAGTDDTVAPHNCRFWGITGPAPPGLIDTHLRSGTHDNLKELSLRDRDGWGIVSFPTAPGASALVQPLARRGGVYAANPYDPDFDLALPAFYYARVLEVPTPRWNAIDANRYRGKKIEPGVRTKQQERAYTSPIWYTPSATATTGAEKKPSKRASAGSGS